MTILRRFIAGAVCPVCGRMDTVRRCQEDTQIWWECVSCATRREEPLLEDDEAKPVVIALRPSAS